tara:strand:+ start:170 stop:982 length:813 start_codon:yes stop_codon:yes gene_type:complete
MNKIDHNNLPKLLPEIDNIARRAGDEILKIYKTDFSVCNKEDDSPLTSADTAAHEVICKNLSLLTPQIPILSEESSHIDFSEREKWEQYWLVDPLDGTREFIKKNDEFTVNIALIDAHQSVLGVVHIPVIGTSYLAAINHGSHKCDKKNKMERIFVREINEDTITIAGSRSHGNQKQQSFISKIKNAKMLSVGSSKKFCLVAEGKADIYPRFGSTSEWDTAAGQCIVEESGGKVIDEDLNRIKYNTKSSLINPSFFVIGDMSFNWNRFII